jgi:2-keto-3-deoxy-L-rhamnonate aldolase RhmA
MLQAISTTNTVPITRVPWLEPGIIMKSLDAGAYGIIWRMVTRARTPRRWSAPTATRPAAIAASARCGRSCSPARTIPTMRTIPFWPSP